MIQIIKVEIIEKGKKKLVFDTGITCLLYRGEVRELKLEENSYISLEQYEYILKEIVGKRAKKRALYLLEQMDRTEQQLRDKLLANGYPLQCIEDAIAYVKSFHYLDDYRYASTYIHYYQEKLSKQQLKQKLIIKGVPKDLAEQALEAEYVSDESEQIVQILHKKKFEGVSKHSPEFRKMYQYLLRRGFSSSDILKEMNQKEKNFESET